MSQNTAIDEALLLLNKGGEGYTIEEMYSLSMRLKRARIYNYARRILALAREDNFVKGSLALKLDQQCALCTYKDVDLPAIDRLDQALQILKEGRPDLDNSNNAETLGLAGAIYKRRWETDGQKKNLEIALEYYKKGLAQGIENDYGYTAINAAFISDLLDQQEKSSCASATAETSSVHALEAEKIRKDIIATLVPLFEKNRSETEGNYWLYATIAEAYFGLGNYDDARPWLKKVAGLPDVEEWQIETTTKQLAHIAMLKENREQRDVYEKSAAWEALKELIIDPDDEVSALKTAFNGKIGLALSGGGFRASLYHIGVLAKLAEFDLLRQVEVLSCVSGGSILGAYYYLEVRDLIQNKTDKEITQQDYIDIVDRMSKEFLKGVQTNIRTRVVANWWVNFKMLWEENYSRTERVGELYEKELFSRVKDNNAGKPRWLNHLFIYPKLKDGSLDSSFNPKYDNWRRLAKVPILVLNATTLNTGHNWQFTASWMGESPVSIQKIDGNYRLRRMYYKNSNDEKYDRKMRLGYAVAASACVPGMFEPLSLRNIYPGKIVRLVDGGVHDNQGICGLLEQDCNVMMISDASGQMGTIDDPSGDVFGVPLRANDILQERVRNAQFQDMDRRYKAGLLKDFMFIHLKLGLDVPSVDWVGCEDPSEKDTNFHLTTRITAYNIRKDVQKHLAAIRTDLDSFNDTEAYALMMSGYLMTAKQYPKNIKGIAQMEDRPNWQFMQIQHDLVRPDIPDSVIKLLEIGKERAFKIWKLSPVLTVVAYVLAVMFVIGFFALVYYLYDKPLVTVGQVGWTVFWFLLGMFISKTIIRMIRYRDTVIRFATGLGVITFGWIAANIHLLIFDKLYLNKGKRK